MTGDQIAHTLEKARVFNVCIREFIAPHMTEGHAVRASNSLLVAYCFTCDSIWSQYGVGDVGIHA